MHRQDSLMFRGNSFRRLSVALALLLITLSLFTPVVFFAQTKKPDEQKQGMGVSTGAARSSHRNAPPASRTKAAMVFEDITGRTALASFRNRSGAREKNYIVKQHQAALQSSIMTLTAPGYIPPQRLDHRCYARKERAPRAALYHNLGNWRFEDVTDKAECQ
jgi:hypothetical protein